jgi:hypothetical protein
MKQVQKSPMPFKDRTDVGRQLARALAAYHDRDPVIIALSRGNVTVAAEIALALAAPLDLILVRKIGVPRHAALDRTTQPWRRPCALSNDALDHPFHGCPVRRSAGPWGSSHNRGA